MTGPGRLTSHRRAGDLQVLAERGVDVLVVGGGVTGAGVALDAAARGLTVALCERTDLAAGTSRWSSKLVHGGLRYLAHGEFGLARESARERAVLMRTTAPHLTRPLPFLVPDEAGRDVSALAGLGGRLGDAVRRSVPGGRRSLPGTARVSARDAERMVPGLRPGRGGVVFWDGQLTDDARLVVALARTAAVFGARVLTGVTVTGVDGPAVHRRPTTATPPSRGRGWCSTPPGCGRSGWRRASGWCPRAGRTWCCRPPSSGHRRRR
jgi:glycerol-3-phosphate dehydrogenase